MRLSKDWYVTQVLASIVEFQSDLVKPLFCGGTSLMKGYGLIERFSEDLDFRLLNISGGGLTRSALRSLRRELLDHIQNIDHLTLLPESLDARNASKFFSVGLTYPRSFPGTLSLRPEIKVEFNFIDKILTECTVKEITPAIEPYYTTGIHARIDCVSVIETAADKLSALTWRTLNRKRNSALDDQAMIRHLYDLEAILGSGLIDIQLLLIYADQIYDTDRKRGDLDTEFSVALKLALAKLSEDAEYRSAYSRYVLNMCFGASEHPRFDEALEMINTLVKE